VSSFGSDVNHIFFQLYCQSLKVGVIVHFHDIFLPWDYPHAWIKRKKKCWNEAYLLLAFPVVPWSCDGVSSSPITSLPVNSRQGGRARLPSFPRPGRGLFLAARVRCGAPPAACKSLPRGFLKTIHLAPCASSYSQQS